MAYYKVSVKYSQAFLDSNRTDASKLKNNVCTFAAHAFSTNQSIADVCSFPAATVCSTYRYARLEISYVWYNATVDYLIK